MPSLNLPLQTVVLFDHPHIIEEAANLVGIVGNREFRSINKSHLDLGIIDISPICKVSCATYDFASYIVSTPHPNTVIFPTQLVYDKFVNFLLVDLQCTIAGHKVIVKLNNNNNDIPLNSLSNMGSWTGCTDRVMLRGSESCRRAMSFSRMLKYAGCTTNSLTYRVCSVTSGHWRLYCPATTRISFGILGLFREGSSLPRLGRYRQWAAVRIMNEFRIDPPQKCMPMSVSTKLTW